MAIHGLEWESSFFTQRIGKVDVAQLDQLSTKACEEWDLVQANVASTDYQRIDKLCRLGFALVEGEAEFILSVKETSRQPAIRIARISHITALRELAATLFGESRFRAPWFDRALTQQFYAQWIDNAVQGIFDHQCLVSVDDQGAISGFVSLRASESEARIGLLGVAPSLRGRGIGHQLLLAAADWTRAKGLTELHITTQLSNLAAMRLYLRHGARLMSTRYWLYRKNDDSF